ncbi:MAG: hypothetical protein KBH81_04090 [Phycisphaerae bacterium]|nr:hypothetical protein [Phycisphaerae bacterium]
MNVEHHVLAALAGPIASAMYTGGDRAERFHAWAVALHEAAHAAVATSLGIRLEEVSILPGNGTLGHCRYRSDATIIAPRSDTSQALCLLWLSQGCTGWCETRRHLRQLRQRAHDLVRAELYPIHRLAEALREHYELSGEEAEQILAAARSELAVGSFLAPISSGWKDPTLSPALRPETG